MARVKYTAVWEETNVRPTDYNSRTDNCGDCTTRCLTWLLKGDYRAIEARQYELAKEFNWKYVHNGWNYHRNTTDVYSVILHENGYKWIHLTKTKARGQLAVILSKFNGMASLSRTHICPIANGKVIDSWDSTAGQVFGLCVKVEEIEGVRSALREVGIETEVVDKIRHKANRRRSRYSFWG